MTKFMLKMFAGFPEPDGMICTVAWFLLLALFTKEAWIYKGD